MIQLVNLLENTDFFQIVQFPLKKKHKMLKLHLNIVGLKKLLAHSTMIWVKTVVNSKIRGKIFETIPFTQFSGVSKKIFNMFCFKQKFVNRISFTYRINIDIQTTKNSFILQHRRIGWALKKTSRDLNKLIVIAITQFNISFISSQSKSISFLFQRA